MPRTPITVTQAASAVDSSRRDACFTEAARRGTRSGMLAARERASERSPLHGVWCIISSDDITDRGSVLTGDAVVVEIIRRCTWRDFRA